MLVSIAAHAATVRLAGELKASAEVPAKDSPIDGTATLTPEQAKELVDGKWYFNLHTSANPGGEIRGQILKSE
jgi:hypothetical protein